MDNFINNQNLFTKNTDSSFQVNSDSQKRKYSQNVININFDNIKNPIFVSVSEGARLTGVGTKTIRRALQSKHISYKIVKERYQVDLASLIEFMFTSTKLRNKLNTSGLGQYIAKWKA